MPTVLEAPTAPVPETLTGVRRKRWTRNEIEDLVALGKLPETGYELIEGDLIEAMPKNIRHVVATNKVLRWIYASVGGEYVQSQDPIAISNTSTPEPDVCVLREPLEMYLATGTPSASEAMLVVEVADSTLDYDRTIKAGLYARAGVPEYWILDITNRVLLVLRQPGESGYASLTEYTAEESVASLAVPNAAVEVIDLLP